MTTVSNTGYGGTVRIIVFAVLAVVGFCFGWALRADPTPQQVVVYQTDDAATSYGLVPVPQWKGDDAPELSVKLEGVERARFIDTADSKRVIGKDERAVLLQAVSLTPDQQKPDAWLTISRTDTGKEIYRSPLVVRKPRADEVGPNPLASLSVASKADCAAGSCAKACASTTAAAGKADCAACPSQALAQGKACSQSCEAACAGCPSKAGATATVATSAKAEKACSKCDDCPSTQTIATSAKAEKACSKCDDCPSAQTVAVSTKAEKACSKCDDCPSATTVATTAKAAGDCSACPSKAAGDCSGCPSKTAAKAGCCGGYEGKCDGKKAAATTAKADSPCCGGCKKSATSLISTPRSQNGHKAVNKASMAACPPGCTSCPAEKAGTTSAK